MFAYIVRRVIVSFVLLIGATFIAFWLVSLTGDPLGELRSLPNITEERIAAIREGRGLDEPFYVRYWMWVSAIPTDGFGTYLLRDTPIWPELRRVMGHTLQLVLAAEVLALTVGVGLGMISAKRQYSILDYTITGANFIQFAVPVFALGLIFQVIAIQVNAAFDGTVFYLANLSSPNPGTGLDFWLDRAHHLVLPVVALAGAGTASYSRYMRASMLEVVNSDYVRTARSKGLREGKITFRHAFRNAMIPIVTLAGINIGTVFAGALVTEVVFGLDGMGMFFINYMQRRDPYAVMAFLLVTGVAILIANLIVDILYGWLDPRIRRE